MANIVYLVGAGFSKSLEKPGKPIPLMLDFVSVMADYLHDDIILTTMVELEIAGLYEWKSDRALQIAQNGYKDVQSWTTKTRSEFRRALKDRPRESVEMLLERSDRYLRMNFRYAINRFFYLIEWDLNWYPLDRFIDRQFQGADSHTFVSFNYDLLLDRSIEKHSTDWNVQNGYGFEIEYFLDEEPPPSKDGFVDLVKAKPLPVEPPAKVSILKPHGSLNWLGIERIPFQYGPGGTLFEDRPPIVFLRAPGEIGYFGSRDALKKVSVGAGCGLSVEPYIVPPVAAAKSQSPVFMSQVRRSEEEAITSADEIYLIGWSLPETDKDQESLIRCAVRNRECPVSSLTVVNLGAGPAYFRRIAEVFGVDASSMKVCNDGFGTFVDTL